MKFGHEENEAGRLVRNPFLFFGKVLYEVQTVFGNVVIIYFDSPQVYIQ